MKIDKIKINGFGNLENKEIDFKEHINLIYGKNEAGKSTLLKFIISMFYGVSKNKRGKDISDLEKYKPWNQADFSGKLSYELANGESYEIFREFQKKSPKLFNKEMEDIAGSYSSDKTKGNEFFFEQTKIDEELFTSSLASLQTQTKIELQDQNLLIQKITNLVSTGDDSVSYQKIIDKLNKKQTEEIGTEKTKGRPINIICERLQEIDRQQKELKQYMKDLCLLEYAPENETEQAVLLTEWENFAKVLLASCTGSKTYCSTLFGIVPIKDASVARKIAEEIDFVTRTYPQKLELADEFAPFREVMVNTYCNMIENGSSYWYEVVNS